MNCNRVLTWMEDRCITSDPVTALETGYFETFRALRDDYERWCAKRFVAPLRAPTFSYWLRKHGAMPWTPNKVLGIKLTAEPLDSSS